MVMLDRTRPRELKYVQKDLNEASEKAFFTKEWLITTAKCAEKF